MTDTRTGLEVHLAARSDGFPTLEVFRFVRVPVPKPGPGEVLVRNRFMSIDPGMLMRIEAPDLPLPMYTVGEVLHGDAVGEVVASADPAFSPGDAVLHQLGWREYALAPAERFRRIDPDAYPTLSTHLGFGLVAYTGLLDVAGMRPGETVFVSSAAGATGSAAGQIARLKGAGRVVGSTGSPEKVRHLVDDLGFDAAFDYHDGPVVDRLREVAPAGIDVYFDNVGGEQLTAAIEVLRPGGRIVLCGALGRQRSGRPDPVSIDPLTLIGKRLTLHGFTVLDHMDRAGEFGRELRGWLREGRFVHEETVVQGLQNAPQALLDQVHGRYRGKVVIEM